MSPKPKPNEPPVPINFRISPKEKKMWKIYAKRLGIPMATFIKNEIKQIVNKNFINYPKHISALINFNTSIIDVLLVIDQEEIRFQTEDWGSTDDYIKLSKLWGEKLTIKDPEIIKWHGDLIHKVPKAFIINNSKFSVIRWQDKFLVAKDENESFYLIGARKSNTILFAKVLFYSNKLTTLSDLYRTVEKLVPKDQISNIDEKMEIEEIILLPESSPNISTLNIKLQDLIDFPSQHQKNEIENLSNDEKQFHFLEKIFNDFKGNFDQTLGKNDQDALQQIEYKIGRKLTRITSKEICESWNSLESVFKNWKQNLIWPTFDLPLNESFPSSNFSNHYIAYDKYIILISIENGGLTYIPHHISKLKELRYLNLSNNVISSYYSWNTPNINSLTNLEYVFLKSNKLSDILPSVERFLELKVLDISDNLIKFQRKWFDLPPKIKKLDLRSNSINKFQIRHKFVDYIDQGIILCDELQLHPSVLKALNGEIEK